MCTHILCFFLVCGFSQHTVSNVHVSDQSVLDSALLQITNNAESLLTLDTNGYLTIDHKQIYMSLQSTDEDGIYNLLVKTKDHLIIFKERINGISKVFVDKDHLLFTVYTFFSEDGANEGEAILINTQSMNSRIFKQPLRNTCNPAFYNGSYYFVDRLCLIQASADLRITKSFPLIYKSSDRGDEYLDTYLVCGLSKNEEANLLQIGFTPRKSEVDCLYYGEKIKKDNDVLVIMD